MQDLYTGKFDRSNLLDRNAKKENIDYNFRIIHSQDLFHYAFCNGELMSEVGYQSYRTALRMNVLPLLIKLCEENKRINIEYTKDWVGYIHNEEISQDNVKQFLSRYEYPSIVKKYGNTEYSVWLHNLIDDWNDTTGTCLGHGGGSSDEYKIDAKEIEITDAEVTIHEMDDAKHRNSHIEDKILFANGIPLDCMMNYERVLHNGLVVGENNLGQIYPTREKQIEVIANMLIDAESHSIISEQADKTTEEIANAKRLIKTP